MSKVFIKNFGNGNYMWPEAKEKSWISLISDSVSFEYVKNNDEDGYREYVQKNVKTSLLKIPDDSTLTMWWNGHFKFSGISPDDFLIHDDGKHLYWAKAKNTPITYDKRPDPHPFGRARGEVTISIRETEPWKNRDLKGRPLELRGLHPRVREILRTQMTMATASDDNGDYAKALISGDDLSLWHERQDWVTRMNAQGHDIVTYAGDWAKSMSTMWHNASDAVRQSGKSVASIRKTKEIGFKDFTEFKEYMNYLHERQSGLCALTNLPYEFHHFDRNKWKSVSLDRIDSDLGYVRDNLQLTCWFANKWKQADQNSEFIRLISDVRHSLEPVN